MSSETNPPALPEQKKSKTGVIIAAIVAVVAVAVAAFIFVPQLLAGNTDNGGDNPEPAETGKGTSASDPIRIGVVSASDPYWVDYKAATAAEGLFVEIVNFSDYSQPNPALDSGEIDLNQFQHIIFLANYNVSNNSNLEVIGSTAIYPLGLYSKKYTSVADIPAGETAVVPDDTTNQARGLLVLQSAGLIKLKDGGTTFSTLDDVLVDESKLKVIAVEASLTAPSLEEFAVAIINNNFIANAGLEGKDAIAQDDPSDPAAQPYINIFATRAAAGAEYQTEEGKALYQRFQKLVEIYQNTKAVTDGVVEASGNTAVILKTPVSELQAALVKQENDLKNNQ